MMIAGQPTGLSGASGFPQPREPLPRPEEAFVVPEEPKQPVNVEPQPETPAKAADAAEGESDSFVSRFRQKRADRKAAKAEAKQNRDSQGQLSRIKNGLLRTFTKTFLRPRGYAELLLGAVTAPATGGASLGLILGKHFMEGYTGHNSILLPRVLSFDNLRRGARKHKRSAVPLLASIIPFSGKIPGLSGSKLLYTNKNRLK